MKGFPLYLDEDSSSMRLVASLRSRNVDVITTSEARNLELSDEDQLLWAFAANRVIYTFNTGDFCALHKAFTIEGRQHAGIIVARQQHFSVGEQLRRILRVLNERDSAELQNQLEFLSKWS